MKITNSLICLFILLILCTVALNSVTAQSTKLSQTNLSYLYNPGAPLTFDSRVAIGTGEATVFLKVRVGQTDNAAAPDLRYEVRSSYQDSPVLQQDSIGSGQLIKQEGSYYYYRFSLPVEEDAHYLFVFARLPLEGIDTELRYDISLQTENSFPLSGLVTMRIDEEVPLFRNFLEAGEPFRIVSVYGQQPRAFAYYYSHNFSPNPPPMAVRGSEAPQNMSIDSLFSVGLDDSLRFEKQGLYFVQTDTASLTGISFRIVDKYFPRLVRAEEIIEPLRYISTAEEMEQLEESEDNKQALDRYWMKVTRSQDRAKTIIRSYFRQVTEANMLFTTYKEGWKTGQGMVYVLYGKPDQVFRQDDKEVWIYDADRDLVDLSFTFVKVKNIYTDQHYNLVPDEDYKKFWFRNIDLWRKGMKSLP